MIIVVASRYNSGAKKLVNLLNDYSDAKLLTSDSLASTGWSCEFGFNSNIEDTLTLDGQVHSMNEVDCILVLLQLISIEELPFIEKRDRAYIAQEMNAFLLGWLYKYNKLVINTPTPSSLMGISWKESRWIYEVSKFDIAVKPIYYDSLNLYNHRYEKNLHKAYFVLNQFFHFPNNDFLEKVKKFIKRYNIIFLTIEYEYIKNKLVVYRIYPSLDITKPYIQQALCDLCIRSMK